MVSGARQSQGGLSDTVAHSESSASRLHSLPFPLSLQTSCFVLEARFPAMTVKDGTRPAREHSLVHIARHSKDALAHTCSPTVTALHTVQASVSILKEVFLNVKEFIARLKLVV